MDDVFYFPHDPSQPVNFSSSSSFTSSSYEFNDSISQSMSISSSCASNRLTSQNISTFSGSEAGRSQNTSTAFSYAPDRLISQNISSPSVSEVGYEAFQFFLSYLYTGELNPPPLEVSTCFDEECAHEACRPAIDFTVDLMYASSIFNLPELVVHFQGRLVNFADKAYVEDVIPILLAAFHCQSDELVNQCVGRIARSDLDSISIEKELPYEFSKRIELSRKMPTLHEKAIRKAIRKIHKALDWDDIELVELFLRESNVTLDDANYLHYAVAHCDSEVVHKLLHLCFTDVNRRNSQGYTPLHIAAMRREPSIIVFLLEKGACASDLTFDGRRPLSICRRLTSIKNYNAKTEQGQLTNKDRLCIDILEREMRRNPMADDASITSQDAVDDTFDFKLWLKL